MDAMQMFMEYASRFDSTHNGKMKLKIVHTQEVTKVMERLTQALHLPEKMRRLAYICAVYHDIGRFEQLKRYDTFWDHQSIDHAQLSCEILKEEHLLEELSERERQMILTAIGNHNKLAIEPGLDEETMLLCQLIRDADKCDIFRVFAFEDIILSVAAFRDIARYCQHKKFGNMKFDMKVVGWIFCFFLNFFYKCLDFLLFYASYLAGFFPLLPGDESGSAQVKEITANKVTICLNVIIFRVFCQSYGI